MLRSKAVNLPGTVCQSCRVSHLRLSFLNMKFVLNDPIWCLLAVSLCFGVADKCSSDRYMGNFFHKAASDYSKITWAHGVNSREYLNQALKDDSMMLEADISLGTIEGISAVKEPIMAHPPAVESDITLSDWLKTVIRYRSKGIKLDFKSADVLEPSFLIIKEQYSEINFPVWINADILPGPVKAPAIPVEPDLFLQLCKLHLPRCTISPSWTTFTNSTVPHEDRRLNWKHVHDMAMALRDANITQPVTFPVRAAFVRASMELLEWLINAVPGSSITVWSGVLDNVDLSDLLVLRKTLPFDKVYYDLPPPLNEQFHAQKDHLDNVEHDNAPYFDKTLFTTDPQNSSVIVAARTMVLCGRGYAAFNYPLSNNGLNSGFEIFSAVVEFLDVPGNSGFDAVVFRFRNHSRAGQIKINMLGEIQFWDGFPVVQIQTNSRKHQIKISVLSGSTRDPKEENASVLVCLQPLFEDSGARESNSPTICQEVKISGEPNEPLFTITSPDRGIKVLKDLRSSLPAFEASSAGRLKLFFGCLAPVLLGVLISGLNFWRNVLI